MRRLAVAILALALSGCGFLLGLPPDTFDDMWRSLDSVAVPGDFQLIAKTYDGLRSGFAGSGPPEALNSYSAPWHGGDICSRLREILQDVSSAPVEEGGGGSCGWHTTIPAGWRARLVGVATYRLAAYAVAPDVVAKYSTDKRCAEIPKRDKPLTQANEPLTPMPHPGYSPACWHEPSEALVSIRVVGEFGW